MEEQTRSSSQVLRTSCEQFLDAQNPQHIAIDKSSNLGASERASKRTNKPFGRAARKIAVEIRHIIVDSLENGEVKLFLRPNASLACGAISDRFKTVELCTFTTEQWIPHSPRPGR